MAFNKVVYYYINDQQEIASGFVYISKKKDLETELFKKISKKHYEGFKISCYEIFKD